jgi:hypothetical protein
VGPLEGFIAISFLCRKLRKMANENPTLSASFLSTSYEQRYLIACNGVCSNFTPQPSIAKILQFNRDCHHSDNSIEEAMPVGGAILFAAPAMFGCVQRCI